MKIVGITSDYNQNDNNHHNYSHYPFFATRIHFVECFSKLSKNLDISFVIIPCDLNQIDKFTKILDGLVLTGGRDIDPKFFYEEKHHTCEEDSKIRTEFEIKLLKKMIKKNKPIIGICRGMQLINIALGGSNTQDIATFTKTSINHNPESDKESMFKERHRINIQKGSLIHEITKKSQISVNSIHHQCIGRLGKDILPTSFSEDGYIIESIELKSYKNFLLGVQWHPESLATESDKKIIKKFCNSI